MIIQSFILFTDRPYTDEDDNLFVRGQPVCDDWWSIHDGHVVCRSGQFFPKKFNFGQFSTSESEKYGEIFLPAGEKLIFLAEYTYAPGHNTYKTRPKMQFFSDFHSHTQKLRCYHIKK